MSFWLGFELSTKWVIYGPNFGALGTLQDGKKNARNEMMGDGQQKWSAKKAKWNAVTASSNGVTENNLVYL